MSLLDLDQMFDLDLALTTPPTTSDDPGTDATSTTRKHWDEPNASEQSRRVDELPMIDAANITAGACTVCMERFQSGARGKQVPCGHVFHPNCIDRWLSVQNSCPLCRFSVYSAGHGGSVIS